MTHPDRKNSFLKVLTSGSAYQRFEALEHYTSAADNASDVSNLIRILKNDTDPIVRHEAAAQMLRLETINPSVTANMHKVICDALVQAILTDPSIIVKHEAMEALSYVGDSSALEIFERLVDNPNCDIQSTAKLSYEMLRFRLEKEVAASGLGAAIGASASSFS
jgi:HEAT repeat protein